MSYMILESSWSFAVFIGDGGGSDDLNRLETGAMTTSHIII